MLVAEDSEIFFSEGESDHPWLNQKNMRLYQNPGNGFEPGKGAARLNAHSAAIRFRPWNNYVNMKWIVLAMIWI